MGDPGEVIDELRQRLATDPTTLTLFERHISDDRDAIGFALTTNATILSAPLPDDERPRGDGSVSDVADVPQHPSQGAGTDPSPAPLCGYVMATCRNEPEHPGEHWHPSLAPQGGSERSEGPDGD